MIWIPIALALIVFINITLGLIFFVRDIPRMVRKLLSGGYAEDKKRKQEEKDKPKYIGTPMRIWNYRVGGRPDPDYPDIPDSLYAIHEVYYDDNGEVEFYSAGAQMPLGEDLEDLANDFAAMAEAFNRPVLDLNEIDILLGIEE